MAAPNPTRTRLVRRERVRAVTRNGRTRNVTVAETVPAPPPPPAPPRDWDRVVLGAVAAVAALVCATSAVWTAVSIGGILARVADWRIAVAVAAVFELAWLVCQAVEWLARYDPPRASTARRIGWAALVVAMAAIGTHGWLEGSWAAGVVGSLVALLAKGLCVALLSCVVRPLDPESIAFMRADDAEVYAEEALAANEVRRMRRRARVARYRDALGDTTDDTGRPAAAPPAPDRPDTPSAPDPEPSPAPESAPAPLPEPATAPAPVTRIPAGSGTALQIVRDIYTSGTHDPDEVIRTFRAQHPDRKTSDESIRRYVRECRRTA